MKTAAWVGVLLIGLGLAALAFAPRTQTCVTDYDFTICETAPVIAFTVVGLLLTAAGIVIAGVALRHNIAE